MKQEMTTQTKFNFESDGLTTTNIEINSHRIHSRNKLEKFIPNGTKLRSVG